MWLAWKNDCRLLRRCFAALASWQKPVVEEIPPEAEPIVPDIVVEEEQSDHEEQIVVEETGEDLLGLEQARIEREVNGFADEDSYSKHHRMLAEKLSCSGGGQLFGTDQVTPNFFPTINLKEVLESLVALSGERSGLDISDYEYEQEYAEMFERRTEFKEKNRHEDIESDDLRSDSSSQDESYCSRPLRIANDSSCSRLSLESLIENESQKDDTERRCEWIQDGTERKDEWIQDNDTDDPQGERIQENDTERQDNGMKVVLRAWRQFAITCRENQNMCWEDAECRALRETERKLILLEAAYCQVEDAESRYVKEREKKLLNHRRQRDERYGLGEHQDPVLVGKARLWPCPQKTATHRRLQCHSAYTRVHEHDAQLLSHPKPDVYVVKTTRMQRLLSSSKTDSPINPNKQLN